MIRKRNVFHVKKIRQAWEKGVQSGILASINEVEICDHWQWWYNLM